MDAILITAALCFGQAEEPEAVRARIAIAVALQQLKKPAPEETLPDAITVAKHKALILRKPLVIGVGGRFLPRDCPEWVSVNVAAMEGYPDKCVIVAVPKGENLIWKATLTEAINTRTDIFRALGWLDAKEVRQSPVPFAGPQTADARTEAASSWQWTDADIPDYMERYTPAKFTQSIYKDQFGPQIDAVPRANMEEKWRVPGGLAGIKGWKSELWQWAPRSYWKGPIQVRNSLGYFQNEGGHKVRYEPGTEFLDVLKNAETGHVFEVRKAMKTDKGWQRFVTYRRPEHRPAGYKGPRGLDCHACHAEAGTGGYATGLVPGGDTVLSMPFEALEP